MTAAAPRALLLLAVALTVASCGPPTPPAAPVLDVNNDNPTAVSKTIEMIPLPGGRFVMGAAPGTGFLNGYPRHEVAIRPFSIGKYEITFAQYDAFARATGRALPADEGWGRGQRPVIHVSWADAVAFTEWLNSGSGRRFRLPSEAEWEYAARGGTTGLYWWGDKAETDLVNAAGDDGKDRWEDTAPVGQFPANPFGLHDVLGNVFEMVADCRYPTYAGAPADGSAWTGPDCDSRVARGGFFGSSAQELPVAARAAVGEQFDSAGVGFRLAEDTRPQAPPSAPG